MRCVPGKILAKYALAQGVTITASEAVRIYGEWKLTHPADARVFEQAHYLIDTASTGNDDRCVWIGCRDAGSATCYLRGSTELTPTHDAPLCERHLTDFCRALDILRGSTEDEK